MSKAATLIQTKYRRYCEHKRFKKSQEAATCIQTFYRTYKEGQTRSRESTPTAGLKYENIDLLKVILTYLLCFQENLFTTSTKSSSKEDSTVYEKESLKVSFGFTKIHMKY